MKTQQRLAFSAANLLAAVSASLRGAHPGRALDTRIIGGEEATAGEYPYVVSLSDRIGHFCGGSLISPDTVLSAAHCRGGQYNITVGRHALDSDDGETIAMESETSHPEYDPYTTNNDFMLVFLEHPISDQNLQFVKVNSDASSPGIGAPVWVMGWGDVAQPDDVFEAATVLMEVEVNVITNEECDASSGTIGDGEEMNYNDQITDAMLCARDYGEDACQGDSGGPLVMKGADGSDTQVGVVSWGIGCAEPTFPGVYSRVSSAYDWIREQTCRKSSYPPADFDCDNLVLSPTMAPSFSPPTTPWPTWVPTSSPVSD